jgi:energy-coupling factor transporter ATP-binding protein EcfA2
LLKRFQLDPNQKASHLSKGQKTQLALIGAICPEPELLVLDEPTSGLDPIVRREFIETVIGAYQSGDSGSRTVFVSTHLISEFEGLIDEFTIIEQGCELLTMEADAARDRFRKIRARFAQPPVKLNLPGALNVKQNGRELEILADGNSEQLLEKLRALQPEDLHCESLSLEEIFVTSGVLKKPTLENHEQDSVQRRDAEGAKKRRVVELQPNVFGLRREAKRPAALEALSPVEKRCRCCAPVFASLRLGRLPPQSKIIGWKIIPSPRTSAFSASLR